ncbi:hypothetical protein GCM10025876_09090 [Demequina litorisediminis]|uniref:Amidase n=2 Tax=Demequina litorisediminis TaxID=1849022 RepID=A0ABQ6IA56_9MICO|nr:hypothetical protein GCM10025876_09090 [Demequina litorisediminis]
MLYESSFVAERYAAVGEHLEAHCDAIGGDLDATVAGIVLAGAGHSAARLFADQRALEGHRAAARELLADAAAVLTPTTTWHPTLAEVAADPVGANSRMGRFTNYANLLDMAALALPAGRVAGTGAPGHFGAMLTGHAFSDDRLLGIAHAIRAEPRWGLGAPHASGGGGRGGRVRDRRPPRGPAAAPSVGLAGCRAGASHVNRSRLPDVRSEHGSS